jgi:multidrug resistance efflux pump
MEAAKPARKPKPARPAKPRPSELERVEAEIAAREAEVRDLEAKLAVDWSDVETLAAHKVSRDALASLLERWEQLFEQAQA